MGQKVVGRFRPAGERPFCDCCVAQRPSRYRVGKLYTCHWHFPDTFAKEFNNWASAEPMRIDMYTPRRPWDRLMLWLRVKYLRAARKL